MTGQTEVIIGLDVGTTAVKVAAFGVNGAQGELATALHEFRLEQPQPGWQVQDPRSVLDGIDSLFPQLNSVIHPQTTNERNPHEREQQQH